MRIKVDENIRLEKLELYHADTLFVLQTENKLHLAKWLGLAEQDMAYGAIVENIANSDPNDLNFVIQYQGKIVGRIDLHDITKAAAKIGYWIDENHSGKGIVTKSVKKLTEYGFKTLGLNQLQIWCKGGNEKSKAVAKRSGFVNTNQSEHEFNLVVYIKNV